MFRNATEKSARSKYSAMRKGESADVMTEKRAI